MAEDKNRPALPTDANHRGIVGGVLQSDGETAAPMEINDADGGVVVHDANGILTKKFAIADIAANATYKFYGKIAADGTWMVLRKTISTKTYDFYFGVDPNDYTHGSGFLAWAAALSPYDDYYGAQI